MILISSLKSALVDEEVKNRVQNVIYLGPWCFNGLQEIDKNGYTYKDLRIAEPFGILPAERELIDHLYTIYYKKSLNNLIKSLNEYHGQKYPHRFWEIYLGHWYNRMFATVLNRFLHLKKTIEANDCIDEHWGTSPSNNILIPIDEKTAVQRLNRNDWNAMVYSIMIERFFNIKHSYIHQSDKKAVKKPKKLIHTLASDRRLFSGDSPFFIYKPYVKWSDSIKLQTMLKQFPVFWSEQSFSNFVEVDLSARRKLQQKLSLGDQIGQVLGHMLPVLLPKVFLEQFNEALNFTESLPWPKKPKVIYTANGFAGDSMFQLWTAKKVLSGARYVVGQHGNNYGTYKLSKYWPELSTADKFLSWGWSDHGNNYLSKIQPVCNFIYKGNKSVRKSRSLQKVLILTKGRGNRSSISCRDFEFFSEMDDTLFLIRSIISKTPAQVTLRFHGNISDNDRAILSEKAQKLGHRIKIDYPQNTLIKLVKHHDLIVFTYDSTGFLEMLQSKVSVMALFKNNENLLFEHVNQELMPVCNEGVIFKNRGNLSNTIISLSCDSLKWLNWKSNFHNSLIIKKFREKYVKNCKNRNLEIAKAIYEELDNK